MNNDQSKSAENEKAKQEEDLEEKIMKEIKGKREKEPRVFSLQFIQYIDAMNWRFFHERIKTE
ncbi:hypothetical protein, partial [uncultured Dubosiella sp.]|uniref:hypothetical protein n=1 Tax=uncultured Dubosiella sp. TaxID=1937011 RepID=UPI0026388A10